METKALHGFRIFRQEPYPVMLRRLITEQIDLSAAYFIQQELNPDIAIHEIRKSTKRIRAVNRLCRSVTETGFYRQTSEKYREISQLLAPLRLSAVYLETLEILAVDRKLTVPNQIMKKLSNVLLAKHRKLTNRQVHQEKIMDRIHHLLQQERSQREILLPENIDFPILAGDIQKTYSRGMKSLEKAIQNPKAENLHNLRKSVKYLWNQYCVLQPIWPPVMTVFIRQLDLLAEKLGYDHDLSEMENFLLNEHTTRSGTETGQLVEFIALKRRQIQKTITPLALHLYAENPRAMAKRLTAYEKVYRSRM
jgi:CHAD domain-containing protein